MEEKIKSPELKEHHPSDPNNNDGWQQVKSKKKKKLNKKKPDTNTNTSPLVIVATITENFDTDHARNVFESLEKNYEQRRRNMEARRMADLYYIDYDNDKDVRKPASFWPENSDGDHSDGKSWKSGGTEGGKDRKKKKKEKNEMKKTNMTVEEAAAKIDAADLAIFLADNSVSYESQQDIQLMRFADYLGRAFSEVSAAQFPWLSMFKESTLDSIADIPVCHVPESVYKASVEWINNRSNIEALESFVLWALDSILGDLSMQKVNNKAKKKGFQTATLKSQVAMFLVIAMTLRQRPEVMINMLPVLTMNSKYHGQNNLPIFAWMIAQASQGDLPTGMYLWSHFMLPILGGKASSNTQTREVILQSVERIICRPNAKKILCNGATRKGERIIPPSALDLLLHLTFPTSSTRIKETQRFETIYRTLAYVALAGTPRSKSIKLLSLKIQDLALKATTEGNPKLSQEANKLFLWSLTQNVECYKLWENIYANNLETSIAVLKRLIQRWPELSSKLVSQEALRDTLQSFREKNGEAISKGSRMEGGRQALYKEADKYCNMVLKKMFWEKYGRTIFKLSIVVPTVAAFAYIYGYKEHPLTMEFLWNRR